MEVTITAARDVIFAEEHSPPQWAFCFPQMFSGLSDETDRLFSELEAQAGWREEERKEAACTVVVV
jgi:hypothetical protein